MSFTVKINEDFLYLHFLCNFFVFSEAFGVDSWYYCSVFISYIININLAPSLHFIRIYCKNIDSSNAIAWSISHFNEGDNLKIPNAFMDFAMNTISV